MYRGEKVTIMLMKRMVEVVRNTVATPSVVFKL